MAKETIDSKYIQQHLANERTFLAWVRTAIALIGVGFLFSNLHFTLGNSLDNMSDLLAVVIGILSGILGIVIIVLATMSYMLKRDAINSKTFKSSKPMIIILASISITIILIYILYNLL
jgi:putative membrane protein